MLTVMIIQLSLLIFKHPVAPRHIQCHCFRLNATQYILSFFSLSLSQHVSALLGHLQVLITMLNCHTVLIIILATLFCFVFYLTHARIVYIK
jgi:hypothetical protein